MSRVATFVLGCALVACRPPAPPQRPLPPLAGPAYGAYLEGKLLANRQEWKAAAQALRRAAAAAPDQPMIAVELARVLGKGKRPDEAKQVLAAARVTWPLHSQVWRASGDLASKEAATKGEAIAAYRRAIELSPDDEDAYLGLARLEAPAAAEKTLRALVEKQPDSVDGHYRLSLRLVESEQFKAAIPSLRHVLELDPDHLDARLELARALRRTGDLPHAVEQTRSAFDRSGQALDIAEELFWLLCEADDRQSAIDLLTLLDDDRSDVEALTAVARLEKGLGRAAQATAIAAKVALLDQDAGVLLSAELAQPQDPLAAAQLALGVARDSRRHVDARKQAANALLAAGDPRGALAAIAEVREARPRDVELVLIAAFAYADAGDVAKGKALVDTLADGLAPQLARARYREHTRDFAGALAILEPLLVKHPDSPTAHNLAGYLVIEGLPDGRKRYADAERWLANARHLSPGDPAILDSWGWLQYRRGAHREAVRLLGRAARFAPNEPEILFHLAAAWAADGAPRTALGVLDRAAALRPTAAVSRRIEALRAALTR